MKIGYKDVWLDLDLSLIFFKEKINVFFNEIKDKIKKEEFLICEIDDRFELTGYIIEYYKIKCTKKQLLKIILNREQLIDCKYVVNGSKSGELNGFELDTPNIKDFDLIIKH